MITPVFVMPGAPEDRVNELYAWVVIHPNGSEGIPSILLNGEHYPMVSSKRRLLDMMTDDVRALEQQTKVKVELRHFVLREVKHGVLSS